MIPYFRRLFGTSFRKWRELQKLPRHHTVYIQTEIVIHIRKNHVPVLYSVYRYIVTVVGLCKCVWLCVFMPLLAINRESHSVFVLSVCMCLCVIMYSKFLNTISYKPIVGISPNLQLRCSWGQR